MMRSPRVLLAAGLGIAALAVAACSGGGQGGGTVSPVTAAAGPAPAGATLQFTIPNAGAATSSGLRQAQFVSSASDHVVVLASNGSTSFTTNAQVTSGSAGCTNLGSARSCNIGVASPVGTVTYDVTVFDSAGTAIGHAVTGSVSVNPGAVVSVPPLTLNPVPGSIGGFAQSTLSYGGAASAPFFATFFDASVSHVAIGASNATFSENFGTLGSPLWGQIGFTVSQIAATNLAGIGFSTNGSCASPLATVTVVTPGDNVTVCSSGVHALGLIMSVSPTVLTSPAPPSPWPTMPSSTYWLRFANIPPGAVTPFSASNVNAPGETIAAVTEQTTGNAYAMVSTSASASYVFRGLTASGAATKCQLPAVLLNSNIMNHPSVALDNGPTPARLYAGGMDTTFTARLYEVPLSGGACQTPIALTLPAFPSGVSVNGVATDSVASVAYTVFNGTTGGVYVTNSDFSTNPTSTWASAAMTTPNSIVYSPGDACYLVGAKGGNGADGLVQRLTASGNLAGSFTLPGFPNGADVLLVADRYRNIVYALAMGTNSPAVWIVDSGGFFGSALVPGQFAQNLIYAWTGRSTVYAGVGGAKPLTIGADQAIYVMTQATGGGSPRVDRVSGYGGTFAPVLEPGVATVNAGSTNVPYLLSFPGNQLMWIDANAAQWAWPSI